MPVPDWSPERALGIMDEVGIGVAVLSVSSPHVSFLDRTRAMALCRAVNDVAAEMRRRHAASKFDMLTFHRPVVRSLLLSV
jgi:hypothetical protein